MSGSEAGLPRRRPVPGAPPELSLEHLREEYRSTGLSEEDLDPDPFLQFSRWLEEAYAAGLYEPNAMALATASADGRPSARTVLLKSFDSQGFVFYSNYESRKGRELAANPRAAAVFCWIPLARQVCISGDVTRLRREESERYFGSRPVGARLGAWVSSQSRVLENRARLERQVAEAAARFGSDVPLPETWGGFRLAAREIEFWQGRANRLHDRLRYRASGRAWIIERLYP